MSRTVLVSFLALLALGGCGPRDTVQHLSGLAQGTTWHVSLWRPGGADNRALREAIEAEFARLDGVLSNYRSDSVIERFNARATTEPVAVRAEIVRLVEAARTVSEASAGFYDLTVKPLFNLWGFNGDVLTVPAETI